MTGGRRAIVVVLDACGAGELPDSEQYGDAGADTLVHLAERTGGLSLPTLQQLGLGNIRPIRGVRPSSTPVLHGRLHPLGPGKDSTSGHWELMGVVAPAPPPTYPDGFPHDVIDAVSRLAGRGVCCNRAYSGTDVIDDFGEHHLRSGELIVYTSADSVMQVAAHADVLDGDALRALCAEIRGLMTGEHAVSRVIARPFTGPAGAFERTDGRKDFSIVPPSRSYLQELRSAGVPVHAVGKPDDLFAHIGIDVAHPGSTNAQAFKETTALLNELDGGFVFTNLIDTDQTYGHRKDVDGFAAALVEIDAAIAGWLGVLREDDLLILTSDHGVDPDAAHTDHTREHAFLLAAFGGNGGRRHDGPMADVGASVLQWLAGRDATELPGTSFLD